MEEKYKQFMIESNRIEDEDRLNPGDMKAIEYALNGIVTLQDILNIHSLLGGYLELPWVGKLRNCEVIVGRYRAPTPVKVFDLMNCYVKELHLKDSWLAHNEFEMIHPFLDLNGRVGRLIWLSKAVKEGYKFYISFLQMFYYQTLEHTERGFVK